MTSLITQASKITKMLLFIAIVFVAYDYICRAANIYFFWESGVIGWFILLLGFISFFLNRIDKNNDQKSGTVIEKVLVFGLMFILLIKVVVFCAFVSSDAFEVASRYLKTNSQIAREIGQVSGVVLLSEGEVNTSSNSEGEQGQGVLNLVAKGQNKYKLFEIHLVKKYEMVSWQVTEAKPVN